VDASKVYLKIIRVNFVQELKLGASIHQYSRDISHHVPPESAELALQISFRSMMSRADSMSARS
jgi:hypothetical protein